jgi:DnaJ-class molecular chaperone
VTGPLKEPCGECKGLGTVPHKKRVMENGHEDPSDFRTVDICPKCQGEGKVPVNPRTIQERSSNPIVESFLK